MVEETNISPLKSLVAGSIAATSARFIIFPIERVNILYQVASKNDQQKLLPIARRIYIEEGVFAYWKGIQMASFRIAPYMGLKFMFVENYSRALRALQIERSTHFLAGSTAGVTATLLTYPMDLVRARMTASFLLNERYYNIIKDIYRNIGIRGMFRGMPITLKAIAVHDGAKFGLYDATKSFYAQHYCENNVNDISPTARLFSGFLAGAIAQTICYPADVMRRRMQTSSMQKKAPYTGIIHGVCVIYREEGFTRGIYRGWGVSFLKACPNIAIYMSLYDYLKTLL